MGPVRHQAKIRTQEAAWQWMQRLPGTWPGISSNGLHGIRFHCLILRLSALTLRKFTYAQRLLPESQIRLEIGHHFVESGEIQRLLAVAPRLVRIRMHLDQQAICAGGYRN